MGRKVIKYLAWNMGITKYEYRKIIIKENITGNIKDTFLIRILKLSENPWNKDKIIIESTGTINPPVFTMCLKERAKWKSLISLFENRSTIAKGIKKKKINQYFFLPLILKNIKK
tara:strand:+ start:202 stop:546 length:345 start_codon:yes stop_codon:yes gene_type:complete